MELAEKMFNAYNECSPNPWKTFDGRDVPRWPDCGDQVQEKWRAAAAASGVKQIEESDLPETFGYATTAKPRIGVEQDAGLISKVAEALDASRYCEKCGHELPVNKAVEESEK